MKKNISSKLLTFLLLTGLSAGAYEIWEPQPAPNSGDVGGISVMRGRNYDEYWERWSYPIGNGTMGANLFGRYDTERIQITHKHLHNEGVYKFGGLTGFADIFIDFNHENVRNYRRSLNINEAIAHVSYESSGVKYTREYFMNYPDNVLVVRLNADKKGALSFILRPEISYLGRKDMDDRTGQVIASGDLITLSGHMPFFNINFEGQIKVLNEGGSLTTGTDRIEVSGADSVTLIMAAGTNYELKPSVFLNPPEKKLDPDRFPHDEVSERISSAVAKGFDGLKKTHLQDYQNLFGRVNLDLNTKPSKLPTHNLLDNYQFGKKDPYLEELMVQYARYLLIASSREKTLPANLQGTWNQYYMAPWSGGYWHNINVQMNYWGAMSANLAETFEAYIHYFKAYRPKAEHSATEYVKERTPQKLSNEPGGNGWILGSGSNPYSIPAARIIHSGPGTGGLIAKLLVDYYDFTQDKDYLKETGYPALRDISLFYSKALQPQDDGTLLVYPSASPEIRVQTDAQREFIKQFPWAHESRPGSYYITKGCTFDQAAVWECYHDTLKMAETLGEDDAFLNTIRDQIKHLDPILIGESGQIKEFREETAYGSIGEPNHRHLSHLCPLYPGTLINSDHPDWMKAASKTLDFRGAETRGWAIAHQMNCRARLKEGDRAYGLYQKFIAERTFPNLWTWQPPFQIDGSLGALAGVTEMLLQSHEEYIKPLPALPKAWDKGSYKGLVARGNFVFDVAWKNGKATKISVTSRAGGECRIATPGIESVAVQNSKGDVVETVSPENGKIKFDTIKGETYPATRDLLVAASAINSRVRIHSAG